jgi:hypothetical protein
MQTALAFLVHTTGQRLQPAEFDPLMEDATEYDEFGRYFLLISHLKLFRSYPRS